MKKHLFSLVIVAFTGISAFAQIPNNGFETWSNMGAYSNPAQWGTMNNTTAALGIYTAEKGTPGSTGAAYLKLTSKIDTITSTVINGIAVSGVLDSMTMTPKSGFPYTLRPLNLTGKWQHMIYGSSQGSISVTLTRWDTGLNSRVTVASATKTLTGMAMSWANFSFALTYSDPGNPDTCIIVLKASGTTPTNNDYLWVDNLMFSGFAGINENNGFLTSMNVYPNPTSDKIELDLNFKTALQTTIELTDIVGNVVLSKNAGELNGETKQVLDVSDIARGSYLVRVITGSGTETKKIVID